jgi:hypothetical protein
MQKVNNYSWRGSVPGGGFGHQGHADWYTMINPISNQAPGNPPEPSSYSTPYSGNLTLPKLKYKMNNPSRSKRGAPGRQSGRGIMPGKSISAGTQTEGMVPNDRIITQTATSKTTKTTTEADTATAPDQMANAQIADKPSRSTDVNTNEDNADTNDFVPYDEEATQQENPVPGPDDEERNSRNKGKEPASGSGTTFGENLYTGARNFFIGRPAPIIIPPTMSANPNAPVPETFNSLSGQISPQTQIVEGRRGDQTVPSSAKSLSPSVASPVASSPGTAFKNSELYRKVESMRNTRSNTAFKNDVLENPGKYASHSPRSVGDLEQIFKRPKTPSPTSLAPEPSGIKKRYFILI